MVLVIPSQEFLIEFSKILRVALLCANVCIILKQKMEYSHNRRFLVLL